MGKSSVPSFTSAGKLPAFAVMATLATASHTGDQSAPVQDFTDGTLPLQTMTEIPASTLTTRVAIDSTGYREPYEIYRTSRTPSTPLPREVWDLRSVPTDHERYNATVRVTDGRRQCTGSIVTMEGYETTENGILVSTSAHCLIGADTLVESDINRGNIYVNGLFQDEGGIPFEYEAASPSQVWVHPDYLYQETPGKSTYNNEDLALIFFSGIEEPEEVTPYRQKVFENPFFPMTDLGDDQVIIAGYSAAAYGLSVDEATIRNSRLILETDSNHVPGSSGGPTFPFNNPYEAIGVTSYMRPPVDGVPSGNGIHFFTHNALATVPFLYQDDVASQMEFCADVAIEDGLRLRTGPGTDYRNNGFALQHGQTITTNISDSEDFAILDDEGRSWLFVETDDGRSGYTAVYDNGEPNITDFDSC